MSPGQARMRSTPPHKASARRAEVMRGAIENTRTLIARERELAAAIGGPTTPDMAEAMWRADNEGLAALLDYSEGS